MIKKTVQRKNSKTSLKKTKDIDLSIQFSLDGFSFCISDSILKKDIYFSDYTFENTQNSPENLLEKIEEIFKNDNNLQHEFSSILVIHNNNLSTLVPNKYFNENNLKSYLNLNIKTLSTDLIAFDDVTLLNAKNVYIPYVNINNYLFQNFGEFEYKHHLTVLIEKLLELEAKKEKIMYVNVSKTSYDIVVLENKNLILANSFSFNTKEDFIYYILFSAEQLSLNTEEFLLYFLGDIEKQSEIYKITYQYIRNIMFLKNNNSIIKDLDTSEHSNYLLLGL